MSTVHIKLPSTTLINIAIDVSQFSSFQDFLNFLYVNVVGNKNLFNNVKIESHSYGYNWCLANDDRVEITKYNAKSTHLMKGKINSIELILRPGILNDEMKLKKQISMLAEININFPFQNPEYGAIWNTPNNDLKSLKTIMKDYILLTGKL